MCCFSNTILCSANRKTLKCFLSFILCSGWKQEAESVDRSCLTPYAISLAVLSLFSLFCHYFASQHWLHGWHNSTLMLIQLDSLKAMKAWKNQATLTSNRINTFLKEYIFKERITDVLCDSSAPAGCLHFDKMPYCA